MAYTPPIANAALSSYTAPAISGVDFELSVYTPTPKFTDVGDVRSGVVYGASLEQTGTYTASGGSTYSRGRVVNAGGV